MIPPHVPSWLKMLWIREASDQADRWDHAQIRLRYDVIETARKLG